MIPGLSIRFATNKERTKLKNQVKCRFTGGRRQYIKKALQKQGYILMSNIFYSTFTVVVEVTLAEVGNSCPIADTVPEASLVVFED